jgi:hypothetical protein
MQAVLVLASRDANGDGHEPRDGNRDCDPKYRVFQHRYEIPGQRAPICNYLPYTRRQLWANGAIAASRVAVRWCFAGSRWQRPRPDAEIVFGVEVSWCPPKDASRICGNAKRRHATRAVLQSDYTTKLSRKCPFWHECNLARRPMSAVESRTDSTRTSPLGRS